MVHTHFDPQEWLKDTYCISKVDNKQHNIAEVSLKDMYCTTDVKDNKGTMSVSTFYCAKQSL